ncbi:protein of unknown function [Methylocella tundrae]|uniref:Uncharacterized protein n=1 Tax=Methylocella tundrae TaxID=227605 RepID=A0A4U8YZ81_METTU|nr:protein of unknown function [Methylocella tundrae]
MTISHGSEPCSSSSLLAITSHGEKTARLSGVFLGSELNLLRRIRFGPLDRHDLQTHLTPAIFR